MTDKDKERYEQWKKARSLSYCDKCEHQVIEVDIPDDIYEEDYLPYLGQAYHDIRSCACNKTCFKFKKYRDRGNKGPKEREVY